MHSRYALLQNTINFIQETMAERHLCRSTGDDILYRLVFNLKNMMDSKGCINKTTLMESGLTIERYTPWDGILVYRTGCEDTKKDDGHLYDRGCIEFLSNMMGIE